MHYLYNEDVVEEDAILSWEAELKDADEADKVFVKQAQKLIQVSMIAYFFTLVELGYVYLRFHYYPIRSNEALLSYVSHFYRFFL